jgi:flagellar hook-associated protein 1
MPTISSGINIALQGVLANSQAMEITDHNVANANTPGYHRQSAVLTANAPTTIEGIDHGLEAGQQGTGVFIESIQRFSSAFFDQSYRTAAGKSSNWGAQSDGLTQLESTLAETTDSGLIPKLDQFWSGWQGLAADPSNTSLRAQLLNTASSVSIAFKTRATQLTQLRSDQDSAVIQNVAQINSTAGQIAALNGKIAQSLADGQQPNDLMDQRDQLLDQLAQTAGAVSFVQKDGEASVSIGGHVLVVDTNAISLQTLAPAGVKMAKIVWPDGQAFTPPSGTLQGILQVRDGDIPDQMSGLDTLANAFAAQVNAIHQNGYGLNNAHNLDIFSGNSASTISVNPLLNANSIGASDALDQPGNNNIAAQIAQLKLTKVAINGNTETLDDFYNAQVSALAAKTQDAVNNASQGNQVTQTMDDQRQSLAGVSLNEEAANLAKFQQAYQASARMMTAFDSLLDTIINNMGLVGR